MHFKVYDVFYLLFSHWHVSVAMAAIFRVILLLLLLLLLLLVQAYKSTDVVSCIAFTLLQLKLL